MPDFITHNDKKSTWMHKIGKVARSKRWNTPTFMGISLTGLLVLGGSLTGPLPDATAAEPTGTIEVQRSEDGQIIQLSFPLYQKGEIRYFSSGVGLEEREAKYPAFPLKLVFVGGLRAFVTSVSVTIQNQKGTVLLDVPGDQVTGPWLFIDLPAGTYSIVATRQNGEQVKRKVLVSGARTKVVHFRWPSL